MPYALLRGNGHRHVFIVKNMHAEAWNLEDLTTSSAAEYDFLRNTLELPIIFLVFLMFLLLTMLSMQLSS
jgi:hypothetical protein